MNHHPQKLQLTFEGAIRKSDDNRKQSVYSLVQARFFSLKEFLIKHTQN